MSEPDPREEENSRRVLVVLRAGDASLHPKWFDLSNSNQRTWDLHLSYYGSVAKPFKDRPDDVTLSFEPGTSFVGLADCFAKQPFRRPYHSYDWFWLPDDDIFVEQQQLNEFFRYVMKFDLQLSQPALDEDSFVAHPITRRHVGSLLRFTNFVEVMCPCLSRRALNRCLPHFRDNISSWGLDFLFPQLLGYPSRSIAIVDAVTVTHTRPIGSGLHYQRMREKNANPLLEFEELLLQRDISRERCNNLAVVKPDGSISEDLKGIAPSQKISRGPKED